MTDVFIVLSRDHQEVQQMLTDLEAGPTAAAGATDDQLAERMSFIRQKPGSSS